MRRWALWTVAGIAVGAWLLWLLALSPSPGRARAGTPRAADRPVDPSATDPVGAGEVGAEPEPADARPPGSRRLRVRVVSAEGPVPDAEVRVDGEASRATTGADGIGELGTDDWGVVWVRASKEGFREVETAMPGGVDEAEIVLVPGIPLRGRVVRAPDRAPVPGAEVRAGERASGEELCGVLTTDAEGRFAVPGVAPGTHFVVAATAPGFAPAATTGVASGEAVDVVVVLGRGATLSGAARDERGGAAAGVAIRVFPEDDPFLARSPDSRYLEQSRLRAAARATTDAEGGYAVEGLEPGRYVVLARDRGAEARAAFEVSGTKEDSRVDLRLEPTPSILVRVLDPEGVPLPDAQVRLLDAAGKRVSGPGVPHRTDARGEALATSLEPGTYEVIVLPPRHAAARARVVVARGPPAEASFRVERASLLEGTVRDPLGAPVAGLDVLFQSDGDASVPPQHGSAITGRDGRFRIEGLLPVPGVLSVRDWAERWAIWSTDRALPGAQPLSIVVSRAPSVTGRFEPAPGSRRVAYTVVMGESMSGRNDLDLDAQGAFVLTGIEEGASFVLCFDVPGGSPVRTDVTPLVPGERRDLGVLRVKPGLPLRGHAVDGDGRPWAFTRVQLTYEDHGIERYTLTDGDGRFAFDGIDPAALVSITLWDADDRGRYFELEDWSKEPVQELVVER